MTQLSLFATSLRVVPQYVPYPERGSPEFETMRALPVERLELQRPDKNWRGCPIAEIKLSQSGQGWHWSIGYSLETEGHGGPVDFGRIALSRDDALALACADLTERLTHKSDTSAMARAALKWVEAL